MANETTITIIGNLTDDVSLRFSPAGAAVANFTVASTPRTFNKASNEWEDGNTYPVIDVEVSSASHPMWTGKKRVMDTAGRVEKFWQRYGREK